MARIALSAQKAHRQEGPRFANTVTYRDARGQTFEAKVVGGSGTTLNLRLPHHPGPIREIAAVPKRTSRTQTGVWW